MNTEQARLNMIKQQIRPWGVLNQEILDLLSKVKREDFVPKERMNLAFVDAEIPLSGGEFMFTPKLEARILQELRVKTHEHVLEIGTGSGYMAALLAHQARQVTTVEIDRTLMAMAEQNLTACGVRNVNVFLGNGAQGWMNDCTGPQYDAIVISGSLPILPGAFLKQLKVDGRIFAIVGTTPAMLVQLITRRSESDYQTVTLFETDVKPLHNAVAPSRFVF